MEYITVAVIILAMSIIVYGVDEYMNFKNENEEWKTYRKSIFKEEAIK